jgi:hypothetical protein
VMPEPVNEYAADFTLPGVGSLPARKVQELAKAFGRALESTAFGVTWVNTYVADDTLRCVYTAMDAGSVWHASKRACLAPDRVFPVHEASAERMVGAPPAA